MSTLKVFLALVVLTLAPVAGAETVAVVTETPTFVLRAASERVNPLSVILTNLHKTSADRRARRATVAKRAAAERIAPIASRSVEQQARLDRQDRAAQRAFMRENVVTERKRATAWRKHARIAGLVAALAEDRSAYYARLQALDPVRRAAPVTVTTRTIGNVTYTQSSDGINCTTQQVGTIAHTSCH